MTTAIQTLNLDQIKCGLDITDHNYGRITHAKVTIGNWTVETNQHIDEDRNFYSKSWHRKYGARRTVFGRTITLSRKHGKGRLTRTLELSSWAGNYLENAIVNAGLAPSKPKASLSIRLHKAFDAKLIKTIRGHKIYARTLLGQAVDYVIVAPMGTTYHNSDRKYLFRGLYKKIRATKARINFGEGLIDWKACKKLGFCDEGLRGFCSDYGLDIKKQYTPREIEDAVRSNVAAAAPYIAELKVLADAYSYQVSF